MSITIEQPRARKRSFRRTAVVAASTLALGVGASAAVATTANAESLSGGTLAIQTGATSGSLPYPGSWVHLYLDGNPSAPYTNTSSPAADQTYTPLVNGVSGLTVGTAQGQASPAYDLSGNSLSNAIGTPQLFGPVKFGYYTTAAPSLNVASGSTAASQSISSGDLGGWTVAYGGTSYPTSSDTSTGNLAGTVTWNDRFDHSQGGHVKLTWIADITNGDFAPFTSKWQVEGELSF